MAANIAEQFQRTLADIRKEAEENKISLAALCKEAGISRTTPDRWTASTPHSVELLGKFQEAFERKKAEKLRAKK